MGHLSGSTWGWEEWVLVAAGAVAMILLTLLEAGVL